MIWWLWVQVQIWWRVRWRIIVSTQHSVTDGGGMGAESRELMAGHGWELGSRSRLRWDGNAMERQGIVEDVTFRDSDRGRG
jgi:hypothetical protein